MIDNTVHIGNIRLYILLSVFFFFFSLFFLKLLERFVVVKLLKLLQSAAKLVETLCPTGPLSLSPAEARRGLCGGERGFSDFLLPSQEGSLPSPPTVENNKPCNFEWRGGGRGVDCF